MGTFSEPTGAVREMSRSSALIAVVAIAAAVAAAMAALSMRSAQQPASSRASLLAKGDGAREQLGQLRAELSELRRRVHEIEQVAAQPLAPAGDHVAEADPASKGALARTSRLSPKEHDELLVDLSKQLLEQRLREEPIDVQWARGKEHEIEAAFAEHYSSRLVGVTCGSTLCRTVADSTFGGSCWFMRMGEGVGTELYCAREGQQLPRIDPELLH